VVSTIDVPAALAKAKLVPVDPFSVEEAGETLDLWLKSAKRTLTNTQREKLLESFRQTGLPLYLKLAFEEARMWRSFDPKDSCVLGDGLPGMSEQLFRRLSEPGNHGQVLVSHALGFLTAARYGLTEDEMLGVLAFNDVVWEDFERARKHDLPDYMLSKTGKERRQLPVIVWSRLYLDLEPYLTERAVPGGTTISFYHRQLAERAAKDQSHHAGLAQYFVRQSNWRGPQQANGRKITELLRQQVRGELLDESVATLTDLDFVSAKCAADLVFDLQEDYRETITTLPEVQAELREVERRKAELARWTKDLLEYAQKWSKWRDRQARRSVFSRLIARVFDRTGATLPNIIQSVAPWTIDQLAAEGRRIVENPTRLDRMKAFSGFVEQEFYSLVEFGARPGFVAQQAFNHVAEGPLHEAAKRFLPNSGHLLTRMWTASDRIHPKPALLRTLEGHKKSLSSMSITPDGRWAVSGSDDKALRLWALETGQCVRTFEAEMDRQGGVGITSDGRWAVSGSWDNTLRVWDLETGHCPFALAGHTSPVTNVTITPDGRRAVSGSGDNTLRVWDLVTGACLRVLKGHSGKVNCVSMTPDGRQVVSGSDDKTLRVWDLETAQCLRTLEGHTGWVRSVSVTPDGRRAVSGGDDKTVVWDLKTGKRGTWLGSTSGVNSVSLTPDGRRMVIGVSGAYRSTDQTVQVWDLETRECLRVLEGFAGLVKDVGVTADGRCAVSGGTDATLRVWDVEMGICPQAGEPQKYQITGLAATPDGSRVVSENLDSLRVWDVETGTCVRVLKGHTELINGVCITPDGHRAVSWSVDKTLRLWDLKTGSCLIVLEGHEDKVNSVSVTPDGRRAVSAGDDQTLRVWDLETGVCLRVLKEDRGGVRTVIVTPDGHRVLSGGGKELGPGYALRVWDLDQGTTVRVLEGDYRYLNSMSMTPDGRHVVAVNHMMEVGVWELETGAFLRWLDWDCSPDYSEVYSVCVTPDGRRAVGTSEDRTIPVWDLETGACIRVLKGHRGKARVCMTPDGRWVVSVSSFGDQTVRIWDLESGACAAIVHMSAPVAVALSPTYGRLIVGTQSGEVLFLDCQGILAG
jgi:WD40 repeat protein/DNA-directed RNA polymerase subunit F